MSITWTPGTLPAQHSGGDAFYAVVVIGSITFAFLDEDDVYALSSDGGETWSQVNFMINPIDYGPPDGIYGDTVRLAGLDTAAGYSTDRVCIISDVGTYDQNAVVTTDGGTTWGVHAMPSAKSYRMVAWLGATDLCALGGDGVNSATSSDAGATWTNHVVGGPTFNTGSVGLCLGGSTLLGVGRVASGDDYITSSDDGVTWASGKIDATVDNVAWLHPVWNGTLFCTMAAGSPALCYTATDPVSGSWTSRTLPGTVTNPIGLTVLDGFFYAYDADADEFISSDDGITWTSESNPDTSLVFGAMGAGNDHIVIASYQGGDSASGEITGSGSTYSKELEDGVNALDLGFAFWYMPGLESGFGVGGTITAFDLPNLIETVNLTGSLTQYFTAKNTLTDSARFSASLDTAWRMVLTSTTAVGATATAVPHFLGAIVDTLVAAGIASSRLEASAALTAALTFESMIANGWTATLVDTALFAATQADTMQMMGALVDSAVMMSTATTSLRIVGLVSSSLALAPTLTAALQANADASDGLLLYATIRHEGVEYAGWVLNTENKAPSQYTNFAFESLAMFGNRAFGAGAGGIYELTGDDDAGTPIDAYVRTGLLDLGSGKLTKVPDCYIGFASNGDVVIKMVSISPTGAKVEDWFRSKPQTATDLREGRIELAPGIDSRYWQVVIHNTGGEALELESLQLRPVILSRRI
jgi:hypothetical protein